MNQEAAVFDCAGVPVRTVVRDGERYFVLRDLAQIIGLDPDIASIAAISNCKTSVMLPYTKDLPFTVYNTGFRIIPESSITQLYKHKFGPELRNVREWASKLPRPKQKSVTIPKRTPPAAPVVDIFLPAAVAVENIFRYGAHDIRTVMKDGEPWFVARDVCEILDLSKYRDALTKLDADERELFEMDTPGGPQQMTAVNETGLYSLILTSRKPQAKNFKKWVTGTVLPSIRKTGSYSNQVATYKLPGNYTEALEGLLAELKSNAILIEDKKVLEQAIEFQKPKVAIFDQLTRAEYTFSIREASKFVGLGQNKLMAKMRDNKMLMNSPGNRNEPYQSFLDRGILDYTMPQNIQGVIKPRKTPRFTAKGVLWLVAMFVKQGLLSTSKAEQVHNEILRAIKAKA